MSNLLRHNHNDVYTIYNITITEYSVYVVLLYSMPYNPNKPPPPLPMKSNYPIAQATMLISDPL